MNFEQSNMEVQWQSKNPGEGRYETAYRDQMLQDFRLLSFESQEQLLG